MKATLAASLSRTIKWSGVLMLAVGLQSCEETFLDVVPDNVATIDQAFKLRNEAEKYLFTCYAYIPKNVCFSDN